MNGIRQHDDFGDTFTEILSREAESHRLPTFDGYAVADRAARRQLSPLRKPALGLAAALVLAVASTAVVLRTQGGTAAPASSGPQITITYDVPAGTSAQVLDSVAQRLRVRAAHEALTRVDVEVVSGGVAITGAAADQARLQAFGATGDLHFRVVVGERASGVGSVPSLPQSPFITPGGAKPNGSGSVVPPSSSATTSRNASNGQARQTAPDRGTTSLYNSIDCAHPPTGSPYYDNAPAQNYEVGCSLDGHTVYLLAPSDVNGTDLTGATARQTTTSTGQAVDMWEIDLSLKDPGKTQFGTITGQLAANGGQFAVEVDGQVYSAATASQAIVDGSAMISGNFTQKTAQDLAAVLSSGKLPVPLTVRTPTPGTSSSSAPSTTATGPAATG